MNYYAEKYFEGHGVAPNDLPGSARWLSVFARAFNKLSSVGYSKQQLQCAKCQIPTCSTCGQKELCEGPDYGEFLDPK